jgi:hypothetical protein
MGFCVLCLGGKRLNNILLYILGVNCPRAQRRRMVCTGLFASEIGSRSRIIGECHDRRAAMSQYDR